MINIRKLRNNQSGVVSFFTVIFVSILLIAVTTAFIRLMISGQRQATDNDLSARAYYAAEAGVDDVLSVVADELDTNNPSLDLEDEFDTNNCGLEKDLDSSDKDFDISYTCQFVSFDTTPVGGVTGELEDGESYNLDIPNPGNIIETIRLRWHNEAKNGVIGDYVTVGENVPRTTWQANKTPALIRFQTVQFPTNGINSFARPGGTNISNNVTFTYPLNNSSNNPITISSSIIGTACNVNNNNENYKCRANYQGFSKENIFVNFRAINNSTSFQITALDSSGNEVAIGSRLVVDVTGRASDVFRRVRVEVPIDASGNQAGGKGDASLNNVLLIDDELCKELEVDAGTVMADKC